MAAAQEKLYAHWLSSAATPTCAALSDAVREWLVARGCRRQSIDTVTTSFVRDIPQRWGMERQAATHITMRRDGDTKLQEPESLTTQQITLTNSQPAHIQHGQVQRLVVTPLDDDDDNLVAILSIAVTCENTHLVLFPASFPLSHVALVA